MSMRQAARGAVSSLAQSQQVREAVAGAREAVAGAVEEAREGFAFDPTDFFSAPELGTSAGTQIRQESTSLSDAGEVLNRSVSDRSDSGQFINVITPVVLPRGGAAGSLVPVLLLLVAGVVLGVIGAAIGVAADNGLLFFGPHYWVVLAALVIAAWWRRSVVMVPEGCHALVTKFGKLEDVVGPGRTLLLNPWKRVSYIVNTAREYPYNAPIREAPTQEGVKASIDLFLQFRIEDPAQFIFVLGSAKGFSDKLQNAISEVTRSLVYQQRAEDIYDLVGESTQSLLDNLNEQFLPTVRLTSANITHAEPSSRDYRMDLAAAEMIRVARDAYTYEYELKLLKEQNDGDLNKELASLHESLSGIQAEIAKYQAQMDTALERETNRAQALARQRFVEAESTANANAALLEAQALDMRSASAAEAPEILEYQFRQDVLDKLEGVADRLPQVVQLGQDGEAIDFLAIARQLVGTGDATLFSDADIAHIRERMSTIQGRIREREPEIRALLAEGAQQPVDAAANGGIPAEDKVEEIRRSVSDEAVAERVEQLGHDAEGGER
jgi:regulator of protease activity HflC (stomatin/prohibitin superfamily)